VLGLARKNSIDVVLSPGDTTWAIQLVDDGRGKAVRNRILEKFDALLETIDFEATKGKISTREKRTITARFVSEAAVAFKADAAELQNTIAAAFRTGGRMEVNANFDKIKPNRFPVDFGPSILEGHPNFGRSKPYVPFFLGLRPPLEPVESAVTEAGRTSVIAGDGAVTINVDGRAEIELTIDRIEARPPEAATAAATGISIRVRRGVPPSHSPPASTEAQGSASCSFPDFRRDNCPRSCHDGWARVGRGRACLPGRGDRLQ
jgi:hypothetical protein